MVPIAHFPRNSAHPLIYGQFSCIFELLTIQVITSLYFVYGRDQTDGMSAGDGQLFCHVYVISVLGYKQNYARTIALAQIVIPL